MNKSETKFFNTSKKMHEALFSLLETKTFDMISIKELCETANINRSTFYGHYNSMIDLLNDAKIQVLNSFFVNFKKNLLEDNKNNDTTETNAINNYIIPYLKFVKNNKTVFKVFVENLQTFNVNEYYEYLLNQIFIPILSKKGIDDKLAIKYISKYYLNGVTSIVMDWIKRECKDEIPYIANIIMLCNKYTII